MARPKVIHGGRAIIRTQGKKRGIFNSISVDYSLQLTPIDILGSYRAQEIVATHQEPVRVRMSGWRSFGGSPFKEKGGGNPGSKAAPIIHSLRTILEQEDCVIEVFDRKPTNIVTGADESGGTLGALIDKIHGFKADSYSQSVDARGAMTITVTGLGIALSDETFDEPGALPTDNTNPAALSDG